MRLPLFDGHCDTPWEMARTGCGLKSNSLHMDLERSWKFSPYAQMFAIWAPPEACEDGDRFTPILNNLLAELDKNSEKIILCKSAMQARSAFRSGKTAAFIALEGAHIIYCRPDLLEIAYSRGVRSLNITWNNANTLSGSHCQEPERGLSHLGRQFVRLCNRLGILVDVSHLSEPGFWDVAETTSSPIIASHSNSRGVFDHTRNLSDDQFRAIIQQCGVAGINLCPDFIGAKPDLDSLIEHILHFLDLGGEKNISIGTDFDGIDMPVKGIGGIDDLDWLYDKLISCGSDENTAEDIFFNNLMRVVDQVCTI